MCIYLSREREKKAFEFDFPKPLEENRLSNEALDYQRHFKNYKINQDNIVNGYMQLAFKLGYKENKYVPVEIAAKAKDIYDSLVAAQNNGYSAEELANEAHVSHYEYLQFANNL